MKKNLLFIHIPKTAGTSFRLAAEEYFGKKNTFFDYTFSSDETSKEVLHYVYNQSDKYALKESFDKLSHSFLCGHFPVERYMYVYETLNIITFIRNPIDQVVSHYKHYCRHFNYKESIETFIKDTNHKNIQSKMLSEKPLELYGFIGLTEEYSMSIALINDYYNLKLKVFNSNIASHHELVSVHIDEKIIELIKQENREDVLMYEKAKKIFFNRVECFKNNQVYTHLLIQEKNEKKIRGCALRKNFDKPIEIKIYTNDKLLKVIKSKDFRPGLLAHGLPRKGLIGFDYKFEDSNFDKSSISCRVDFKVKGEKQ